jgi:hypothetical protein
VTCPIDSYFWGIFKKKPYCVKCPSGRFSNGCVDCKKGRKLSVCRAPPKMPKFSIDADRTPAPTSAPTKIFEPDQNHRGDFDIVPHFSHNIMNSTIAGSHRSKYHSTIPSRSVPNYATPIDATEPPTALFKHSTLAGWSEDSNSNSVLVRLRHLGFSASKKRPPTGSRTTVLPTPPTPATAPPTPIPTKCKDIGLFHLCIGKGTSPGASQGSFFTRDDGATTTPLERQVLYYNPRALLLLSNQYTND